MDVFSVLLSISLLILVLKYHKSIQLYVRNEKIFNKLPGPPQYPIVGSLIPFLRVTRTERIKASEKLVKDHEKFGFYRMSFAGFRDVRIFCCNQAEHILKSSEHIEKFPTHQLVSSWLGNSEFPINYKLNT